MRSATVNRKTKETDISLKLNIDGNGVHNISTNIGFFDHMLTALSVHGGLDLNLTTQGDLYVDCHHTIEDTGIVLGLALKEALMEKENIKRYGTAFIPMDEALGFCSLDISSRPFLVFTCEFKNERVGDMDTEMVEEFFRAVAFNAGITLHLKCEYGSNDHHKIEAMFKAFAHALKQAMSYNDSGEILSTKGVL